MNPILYAKDTTDFSTMGIGVLSDTLSCICTQDAGCYELEMEYPIGGIHFNEIQHSCFLKVIVPPMMEESPQLFYIVHISKPLNRKVTILAHHISYKLSFIPIKPFEAPTVHDVFVKMAENATEDFPFTFESDKGATVVDMKREVPVIAMELLGGVEGSLLDIAKGEFLWDNYRVVYQDDVGEDKGYELRYGVNVTDLKQEENIADTITGIVPYFYSEGYGDDPSILVTLDEYTLYSEHAANFPFKRTTVMDFSSYFEVGYDEDHHIVPPTKEQLKEVCEQYMTDAGIGVPKVSIDVSFENLARSKEYSFLKTLSLVKIYDTVTVIFPLLGITKKAKVIKTVYDVQQEKYITITIGDKQESLSSRLADTPTTSEIKEQTEDALSQFNSGLRERIDAAVEDTSKSILFGKGGYVVFGQDETTSPPHMDRILIMDTPDESTATNIIQMNQNGIGFSTDGGQTYTQAWGINGHFNTDYISGETIDAITINTANLNGGYLNSMYVNVAEGIRFNYGAVKDSNYVDAGIGSIQTHITANSPITWTGLAFKCNNSGSGSTWTNTTSDGILFDSRNFAVQAKDITLCASHGNRSAGLTIANMNSDNARIILQNRNWGGSGYSRVELLYGTIGLIFGDGSNPKYRVDCDCSTTVVGTDGHTYRVPAQY